jgi:hypothetical protein
MVDVGLFSEEPCGIVWDDGVEPWDNDPVLWLHTIIDVASGKRIPAGFPCQGWDPPVVEGQPHLRVVNGG